MDSNGNMKKCGFDDLIVSYIYDEASAGDRREFESHLVGCTQCTDEFAELSNARLSVFEWQKEAFADLPTPRIVIPFETTPVGHSAGMLAGLRSLFGGFGMPIAAAAGVLVCIGLAFLIFTVFRGGDEQIAANLEVPARSEGVSFSESKPERTAAPEVTKVVDDQPEIVEAPKALKASAEAKRKRSARPSRAQTAERIQSSPQSRKAPALSNFDDNDDKSLRLTDLFDDEIGTRR